MEIGIQNGRFVVIRADKTVMPPNGGFVIKVTDNESGVTFVTSLSDEDGRRFAAGFHGDEQPPAPSLILPSGIGDGDGPEPEREPQPEPSEVPPAG